MAKNLRTLANQLRKNHGFILVPTFDDGITPGTIIDRDGWNDLTKIGHLVDDPTITQEMLGPIEGPTPCMLADFNRAHEMTVSSALDLVQPTTASAKAQFKRPRVEMARYHKGKKRFMVKS